MKFSAKILLSLFLSSMILGCDSDNNFSTTPELKIRSFEKVNDNRAIWKIGFTDGDGDIGVRNDGDPDNFIVTVTSIKDGILKEIPTSNYRIPVVQNIRTEKGIEGEFEFVLDTDLYRFDTDSIGTIIRIDSIYLSGYVLDRSNKSSNTVETPIFTP